MIPLSKGGSNKKTNLQTLCKDCHDLKHPHMKNRKNKGQNRDYGKKFNSRYSSRINESDMLMD
jgi:5-methylcytosine-specific restriction endonuclease McrA